MTTEIEQLKKQLLEAQEGQRAAEKRADAAESARLAAEELTKNPKKALVLKEINEMKKKKQKKIQSKKECNSYLLKKLITF